MALVGPIASATGAFAGWCFGGSAGQWLEIVGVDSASHEGGILGGIIGVVLCAGYVAYRVFKDHRESDHEASE